MSSALSRSFAANMSPSLDRATLFGIIAAFGLVFLAIFLGGGSVTFFDFKSVLIVAGGTIGATLINFPLDDFARTLAVLRNAFFPDNHSARHRIKKILELAERVRAEGILHLQEASYGERDPFFKKCMSLVADSIRPRDIRHILDIEISFLTDRHRRGAQLFQTMGNVAPAMGLLGTVIGLIQMLRNIDSASSIGPAMAVALVTTFYGALLSYVIFLPLAGKLRARSEEEMLVKELTVEGMIGIARGLNPRILEEYLLSYLPPEDRESRYE